MVYHERDIFKNGESNGAGSGDQTRIACLEGRNNNHYTIPANRKDALNNLVRHLSGSN